MKFPDTHASDFDVVLGILVPLPDLGLIFLKTIVDLPAELRVLIQVGNMRLFLIHSHIIDDIFSFPSLCLRHLVVLLFLVNKIQLGLSFSSLFKEFGGELKFFIHFFHFQQSFSQLFSLSS
jgi:hypothetical protein